MKDLDKKLKQIEEHFREITIDQLEENLINAGIETIKPSGLKMIVIKEIE